MRPTVPLALLAAATACAGTQVTPRAFVEGVYRGHDPQSPGEPPWGEARCRSTFSAGLCDLLARDRREAGEEVGRLDGDPLYDAQDMQIANLKVAADGEHAVSVTFTNQGEPRALRVSLVREAAGWRIDDIDYVDEKPPITLRQILSAPR